MTAQGFPFGQRGSVSQTVAFTRITITNGDEAVMRVHWGRAIVPIRITAPYRPS